MIGELFSKPIVVFGCGNTLFGDDGFGPEVISRLQQDYQLPEQVYAADVGTGIGSYLFDLSIGESKPRCIFIVDAVSQPGREPGELFEMSIGEMPRDKTADFSLHQFPSVNLLQEMQSMDGVRVRILAVQIKRIPDEVRPGLSAEVAQSISAACDWIVQEVRAELQALADRGEQEAPRR